MDIYEAVDYLMKHRAEVSIVPVGGNVKDGDYEVQVAFPDADGPWDYRFPSEDGSLAECLMEAAERHSGS